MYVFHLVSPGLMVHINHRDLLYPITKLFNSPLVKSQKCLVGLFIQVTSIYSLVPQMCVSCSHHQQSLLIHTWVLRDLPEFQQQIVQLLPLQQCTFFLRTFPTCHHIISEISPIFGNNHHDHDSLYCGIDIILI